MVEQADTTPAGRVFVPSQAPAPTADETVWPFDPVRLALDASAEMAASKSRPDALCPELGRRLLLAQLEYGHWVLRRVEKVEFERERSVTRRLTIEFLVRPDAPRFTTPDGDFYLVPLSVMQRRTLVNLDLRDEDNNSVSVPGLRLAQQLDASALLAAASTTTPQSVLPGAPGRRFVQTVVAGRKHDVEDAFDAFERPTPWDGLEDLRNNRLFVETLYRLRRNFTLYLFLPVDAKRHRILRMSFDEPTSWKYQIASLDADSRAPRGLRGRTLDDDEPTDRATPPVHHYVPGYQAKWRSGFGAAVGLRPTLIRFQVPSAEHTASYHFEARAPLGLRIVRASLVAGRPNDPLRHVSADNQEGHAPTVGLHATQVPYGSLCRAQVELRLPTGGWLTALCVSCWLVFAVLATVAFHWMRGLALSWNGDQATNVCVLLVSTSAGVATIIAQREFGGLAARLLAWMRGLGLFVISLPIVMAAFLAYTSGNKMAITPSQLYWQERASYTTAGLAGVIALFVSWVWVRSWYAEWRVDAVDRRSPSDERELTAVRAKARGRGAETVDDSPWDMTRRSRGRTEEQEKIESDFDHAVRAYRFDKPSIGIRSAEGWHEWYAATDESHADHIRALRVQGRTGRFRACAEFGTACAADRSCPDADRLSSS